MKKVLDYYTINEQTMAILPAYHIEYESIVIEVDQTYYVKINPLKLIQENCLINGASYDGRRKSVIFLTGYSRCIPIPINPRHDIYVFPTHSPQNDQCSWIFFNHIQRVSRATNKNESVIHFKNGQDLTINISFHTLSKQNFRVFICRQNLLERTTSDTD